MIFQTPIHVNTEYPARKITKKEFLQRQKEFVSNITKDSILLKADQISKDYGMVEIALKEGTILIGKSLGFEADYDADGNQLQTNVLCFESFVSGGVYIITEDEIEDVA